MELPIANNACVFESGFLVPTHLPARQKPQSNPVFNCVTRKPQNNPPRYCDQFQAWNTNYTYLLCSVNESSETHLNVGRKRRRSKTFAYVLSLGCFDGNKQMHLNPSEHPRTTLTCIVVLNYSEISKRISKGFSLDFLRDSPLIERISMWFTFVFQGI